MRLIARETRDTLVTFLAMALLTAVSCLCLHASALLDVPATAHADTPSAVATTTGSSATIKDISSQQAAKFTAESIGIGGGGALFCPAISPHDEKEMALVPDMGGIYISHDTGKHWDRANLHGTVRCVTYDPVQPGVVYAGGSGLWKSTDYGRTFQLLLPNPKTVIARRTQNENSLMAYFTNAYLEDGKTKLYDRSKFISDVLVDPTDPKHIYALGYYDKDGLVYESTDGGENFRQLFTFTNAESGKFYFKQNKLLFKRETGDVFVATEDGLFAYNKTDGTVNHSITRRFADVVTVYTPEDGTTFIAIEKDLDLPNTTTMVFYTKDFQNITPLTDYLIDVAPTTFDRGGSYGVVTYKHKFRYLAATSLDNIYIAGFNESESNTGSKVFPYKVDALIRLRGASKANTDPSAVKAEYLYGLPFRDHNKLAARSWTDGNTYAYGLCASMKNPDACFFTTIVGAYISYDDDKAKDDAKIYPLHSTNLGNGTFTTSGIDEQNTYGVVEDPFHPSCMLLLNTDLGMIRSEDAGKSWKQVLGGIPGTWTNTSYDAVFDKKRENRVYSLWSGRHEAPYHPGDESGAAGGFALSEDGGKTWDAKYSSGIPANSIPIKMQVTYPAGTNEVTIYVATFNNGFYVSHDSGKTFQPLNDGIERVAFSSEAKRQFILGADIEVSDDGRIFALTAQSSYQKATQGGKVFELKDGTWVEIPLPENVNNPRELVYHNGELYVSCAALSVWGKKDGCDFSNYYGGVYVYRNGTFVQIFDESFSCNGLAFDSKGTMYVSDSEGNIYRKEKTETAYTKIYSDFHFVSKFIQISADDNTLYMATFGGGELKLSGLNSLYPVATSSKVKVNHTLKKATLSKTIKASKIKKSALSFKIAAKFSENAKVTYKKVSGVKSGKLSKSYVSSRVKVLSSGKVTLKKGSKPGTYKVKVKLTVNETSSCKKTVLTKTITIKVK